MFQSSINSNRTPLETESLIELPISALGEQMILVMPGHYLGSRGECTPFPAAEGYLAEQHTIDHINCPACIAADESLQGVDVDFARLLFRDAGKYWMRLRRQSTSMKPRTHSTTQDYLNALCKFFGALRLCDITPGHLRGYQIARLANIVRVQGKEMRPWKHKAANMAINHELSVVGQMLTHCRLWPQIQPFYFPLAVKGWSPRTILTEAEEEQLFIVAAKHPEAALAYWVACITNNTTAAGIELRGLRLKHLLLPADEIAEIYIPEDSVKNISRPRKIALNLTARWAIEECYKRALKIGSCEPDHFLFPFRVSRGKWDPSRRASSSFLRKSWAKLRVATGFLDLNPHDLRHHCIMRLLEKGVDEATVTAIAGHKPNSKMLEYYAHQRTGVKYAAVMAIEPGHCPPRRAALHAPPSVQGHTRQMGV